MQADTPHSHHCQSTGTAQQQDLARETPDQSIEWSIWPEAWFSTIHGTLRVLTTAHRACWSDCWATISLTDDIASTSCLSISKTEQQ